MIADFYLQSSNMAERKQNSNKILLAHGSIYFVLFSALDFVFIKPQFAMWTTLIISGTHLLIDYIRIQIDNRIENYKVRFWSFLVDQILHLSVIVATYYLFTLSTKTNLLYSNCEDYSDFGKIVMYGFLFVFLLNPAAVLVKKTISFLFMKNANNMGNNAGSAIGKLERIITAILLLCNQYGVIGLVLTAKSIARFKQLEEREFAEQYLVGTLLSLAISLVSTITIKSVLL